MQTENNCSYTCRISCHEVTCIQRIGLFSSLFVLNKNANSILLRLGYCTLCMHMSSVGTLPVPVILYYCIVDDCITTEYDVAIGNKM